MGHSANRFAPVGHTANDPADASRESSNSLPFTAVTGSIVVSTQRSHPLATRKVTSPIRSLCQPSSAQGGPPVTTTLGRNLVIGNGPPAKCGPSRTASPPPSPVGHGANKPVTTRKNRLRGGQAGRFAVVFSQLRVAWTRGVGALSRGGFSRTGHLLLVAAVVLAGVGGAAVGLRAPAWLAGAAGAVTALVAAMIVDRVSGARDGEKFAVNARGYVLDPLRTGVSAETRTDDAIADPLALLRADRSPMPFRGRSKQLRRLDAWRDDPGGSPVLLLSGPAGVGKSRLALRFASRVPAGWVAGWLHARTGDVAVAPIAACGDPTVILVDDADGRCDLAPLLDSLAERHTRPTIRVVLVTRSADGLRASLAARLGERHAGIASGALAIELEPQGSANDLTRWFDEAVHAFARALGRPVPELPEMAPGHAGATQPFVMLQARALLAVLGMGSDPRALTFGQVAEALMRHEKRRWDALARARDWGSGGPPAQTLRERAVAALALLGANSDSEAAEVLRRVPELRDVSAERRCEIAAWVSGLYPPGEGVAPRIRPDVIGEWFVVDQLTSDPALADGLRTGVTDDQAARALGFLARAAGWIEAAGPLFGEFAGGNIRRQVLAVARAALTGEAGRLRLDAVVAAQLSPAGRWTLDELNQLDQLIPRYALPRTHAAIAAHVVIANRALAADPAAHQTGLVPALNELASALGNLGRYREALAAAEEAVTICRARADGDPAARQAGLAAALDNLGIQLYRLGRYEEALTATREAVTTYRSLAAGDPSPHGAGLALALSNLGVWLDRQGRHQEALAAAEEAVSVHRALADGDPAAHQAGLALGLTNLGAWLYRLGRYQEALAATEEAVTVYRSLAAGDPVPHQTGLAMALSNLGVWLDRLGRYQEALAAVEEAVTLRRALADDNPAAHQAELVSALSNLVGSLDRLGRHQEALAATEEAVTVHRALAASDPAANLADLAAALDDLGRWLGRLGRHEEALAARTEAVEVYGELADRDPDRYEAAYRQRLGALLREYEQRGPPPDEGVTHGLKAPEPVGETES